MGARFPYQVRASKTHRTPLLAPELMARTGLSLAKAGADVEGYGAPLAHDGQEPTVNSIAIITAGDRTPDAAMDTVER